MSKPRAILDDQRGAILVMGIAMSAFLAGCLWFLIGIGDAAIQRERLQDAADAGVYASAVYHARGMNVIAMINLVMAAVLSVLAALKVSEILNLTYLGIVTGNCACVPVGCPFDCPWIAPSAALAQDLSDRIEAMTQLEDAVNHGLSAKQKSIAQMVPHQAETRGETAAKAYFPVDEAKVISISLQPGGKRLGLPVQEDTYKTLCDKAALVIGEVAMNPLAAYVLQPAPSGAFFMVAGMVPGVVQSVTSSLCEDTTSNGKTPKKVFDQAKNGDKYFQVYAYVLHDGDRLRKRADAGVDLAVFNDPNNKVDQAKAAAQARSRPFVFRNAGMAEAEFYYDQTQGAGDPTQLASGSLEWDGYKDETMWNMRWRARLRRYRDPPPEVKAMSLKGLAQAISPYVKDVIH